MAKNTESSIAELLNLIGSSLDSWYTGGTLGNLEGAITDWNENTRKNYGTPVEATKVNYLYDLIRDGLAAAQAKDEVALSKIADKLGKIDSDIITSVPGLKQQVSQLRTKIDKAYNDQVTSNILRQSKRQAAEDSARQYGDLTDRQRAMAADPKSRAAKQIADFNKKAMEAGLIDKPIEVKAEGGQESTKKAELKQQLQNAIPGRKPTLQEKFTQRERARIDQLTPAEKEKEVQDIISRAEKSRGIAQALELPITN